MNPYSPPKAELKNEIEQGAVSDIAGKYDFGIIARRWLGCWVDMIVTIACLVVPDSLLGNELYQKTMVIWLGLALAYFVVPEWLWGRTLGKLATGTVVVNERGGRPSIGQVLVRTVFRLIEVNPLLAGGVPAGIVAAISKRKQRLGDLVANTYVILSRDLAKIQSP